MDKSRKMEGDYHGQRWTTWFLWQEGITPSDIQLQFSAVCGQKVPARSTVFSWVWGFSSGKETAHSVPEYCRNIPKK
jgi:hypothetical protein